MSEKIDLTKPIVSELTGQKYQVIGAPFAAVLVQNTTTNQTFVLSVDRGVAASTSDVFCVSLKNHVEPRPAKPGDTILVCGKGTRYYIGKSKYSGQPIIEDGPSYYTASSSISQYSHLDGSPISEWL